MAHAFGPYDEDEEPRENDRYLRPWANECKQCGAGGLHWEQDDDGWFFVNERGQVHKCERSRVEKMAAADFAVLPPEDGSDLV